MINKYMKLKRYFKFKIKLKIKFKIFTKLIQKKRYI